jgi:fused signal recognition particle receptor
LFARLRAGLSRSAENLGETLDFLVARKELDAEAIKRLKEALIRTDMGITQSTLVADLIGSGRYKENVTDAELRTALAKEIANVLRPAQKPFQVDPDVKPFVVLVAGVNGTGKTTTIGKLARRLAGEGKTVVLAAGDTFRAAAIDQLKVWGERTGTEVVAGKPGADAAGLAFAALERARGQNADVLLIDTAGRLQNKAGLMAELEKIVRVIKKLDPSAPHAVLLVLDATTGQNALSQVEAFGVAMPLTGLIMTKLDGTAKGGVLAALAARFQTPVHFIGVGEGEDDLQPFEADAFARAMVGLK